MTQLPPYQPQQPWPGDGYSFGSAPKTSGMAIASLVCGILGLFTCCAIIPSVLGIVFGGVSLSAIKSGAARGQGLAVSGIITGVLGLIIGIAVLVVATNAPPVHAIPGSELAESDRAALEAMDAIDPEETIELIYSGGVFSITESGVILTTSHLVIYGEDADLSKTPFEQISAIEFTAGESFFEDGSFIVETDDDMLWFVVGADEQSDTMFYHKLLKNVTAARQAIGKAPPAESLSEDSEAD